MAKLLFYHFRVANRKLKNKKLYFELQIQKMKEQNLDFEVAWDFFIEMSILFNIIWKKCRHVGFCNFRSRSCPQ